MKSILLISLLTLSLCFKGIDVSTYQGDINWSAVKNSGIKLAIIRAGYGKEISQKDNKFDRNYENAKAVGMPIGVYWYSCLYNYFHIWNRCEVCSPVLYK